MKYSFLQKINRIIPAAFGGKLRVVIHAYFRRVVKPRRDLVNRLARLKKALFRRMGDVVKKEHIIIGVLALAVVFLLGGFLIGGGNQTQAPTALNNLSGFAEKIKNSDAIAMEKFGMTESERRHEVLKYVKDPDFDCNFPDDKNSVKIIIAKARFDSMTDTEKATLKKVFSFSVDNEGKVKERVVTIDTK